MEMGGHLQVHIGMTMMPAPADQGKVVSLNAASNYRNSGMKWGLVAASGIRNAQVAVL